MNRTKANKYRKYSGSYLKMDFAVTDDRSQCVVCSELLSPESMKPSKLLRHSETKHSYLKHKQVEFFQPKIKALNN
jgi:hypothetical protein